MVGWGLPHHEFIGGLKPTLPVLEYSLLDIHYSNCNNEKK